MRQPACWQHVMEGSDALLKGYSTEVRPLMMAALKCTKKISQCQSMQSRRLAGSLHDEEYCKWLWCTRKATAQRFGLKMCSIVSEPGHALSCACPKVPVPVPEEVSSGHAMSSSINFWC